MGYLTKEERDLLDSLSMAFLEKYNRISKEYNNTDKTTDWINNSNMKEMKITPPDGYEIDKEKSTFENIVFKKKDKLPMSWDELYKNWHKYGVKLTIGEDAGFRNVWSSQIPLKYQALRKLELLRDAWGGERSLNYCISIEKGTTEEYLCNVFSFNNSEIRDKFQTTFADLIEEAKDLL